MQKAFWIAGFIPILMLSVSGAEDGKPDERPIGHNWMQFRGENGAGLRLDAHDLPVDLSTKSVMQWSATVPPGHSSPIVVGNLICLTGFHEQKLMTCTLDRATGKELWRRELSVEQFEKFHPQHGPASSTPVSDGQRIFAYFGSFGLIAYELDGREVWRRPGKPKVNTFGSASSPVIIAGRLIMFSGSDEGSLLEVLRPETGELIWDRRRSNPASSWSTPSVWKHNGRLNLLIYEPFNLVAIDLETGAELWSVPGLADEPITIPQIGDALIYTSSYNLRTNQEASGLPKFEQLLVECDLDQDGRLSREEASKNKSVLSRPDADGQGDHPLRMFFRMLDANQDGLIAAEEWPRIESWMASWNHANGLIALRPGTDGSLPELDWRHELGVPECPTPLLVDGRLYAIRNGGVVTCLNGQTGETVFQGRIPAGGPYYASPVFGDGKIFFASARGQITVIAAEPELRILGNYDFGEPVLASPALTENELIIRGQKSLRLFRRSP